MRSLGNSARQPMGLQLVADDVTEFHAARVLLLLKICGTSGRIVGLTKLAKLDFFVRYPDFFEKLAQYLNKAMAAAVPVVESAMVRHHYGPWDKRYYQVLPFLESRQLITVTKEGKTYVFRLTEAGEALASHLGKERPFYQQVEQMRRVKRLVGSKSGSALKDIIYQLFDKEVGQKPLGKVIT